MINVTNVAKKAVAPLTGILLLLFVVMSFAGYRILRANAPSPSQSAQANPTHSPGTADNKTPQPVSTPPPTTPGTANVLFSDLLDGPDRIVTNEYSYWSKQACPYASNKWDMTSGTLMVKNGAGYSGVPTVESSSVCQSAKANNSAIFRLNTKDFSFGNTTTSLDFLLVQHGGDDAPVNSYDGLHIWVRYQSQYALYSVTVSRWDGTVDIKKKVPVAIAHCDRPANDGCYYDLVAQIKRPDLAQGKAWHHADIMTTDDAKGAVHILLKIDGAVVLSAVDAAPGPAYHTGAVGVRGDNTEFYFKNFTVTSS
ncbi:MAG TPA: hypothetical protein VIR03_02800 [Candidatus Saccharimonadales bacterium]